MAPFNKKSLKLGGNKFEDELRFIANELNYKGFCSELNYLNGFWTSRVTSHIPIKDVASSININLILKSIKLINSVLIEQGISNPKIGIAGLNPHAGDSGNFGNEENDIILPAIKKSKNINIDVEGPYPADTIFLKAQKKKFNAVVSMYHDQGQIALKLMGFDKGVTVLGGLPFLITTPSHGTAFDIAGKNIANYRGILEAWKLLIKFFNSNKNK